MDETNALLFAGKLIWNIVNKTVKNSVKNLFVEMFPPQSFFVEMANRNLENNRAFIYRIVYDSRNKVVFGLTPSEVSLNTVSTHLMIIMDGKVSDYDVYIDVVRGITKNDKRQLEEQVDLFIRTSHEIICK